MRVTESLISWGFLEPASLFHPDNVHGAPRVGAHVSERSEGFQRMRVFEQMNALFESLIPANSAWRGLRSLRA